MYIIHETLPSNDPRINEKTSVFGHYWHFTIRYIPDNENIYLDWINHEVLSEEVANSYKISGSYKGTVSVSRPVNNINDVVSSSGDVEYKKYIYTLTEADKENVVKLMKSAMKLYSKNHLTDQEVFEKLMNKIDSALTIEDCNRVMYDYFNVSSASTNNTPKNPEFEVNWPAGI